MKQTTYLLGITSLAVATPLASGQDSQDVGYLEETVLQADVPGEKTKLPEVESEGSAGLPLTLLETPQSVSVLRAEQLETFGLDTVNRALSFAPGVQVEQVETDRTYYTARGFDITNFQYDGLGVPLVYGNVYGNLDSFLYERVEILRGANGLMTGTGNPSATINFVRKRPTADFEASLGTTYGSWDNKRFEADFSGPLTGDGRVRGRFVGVLHDQESYLDRYERNGGAAYGVIEADLTENTLLTFGHTFEDDNADGNLWGANPVAYTDGSPTNYDVSTSTSADWSFWDNQSNWTFLRLEHSFSDRWSVRGEVSHATRDSDSELFYMYGTPDPVTGLGLFAYPSAFTQETDQWLYDLRVQGGFDWLGREHDLVGGFSYSVSDTIAGSAFGPIGAPIPVPLDQWNGNFPRPNFGPPTSGADWTDEEFGFYGATRLRLTDDFQVIAGARVATFDGEGQTYGASQTTEYENEFIPYFGVVYQLTDRLNAYASYTDVFQPQTELDISGSRLDAVDGRSYEAGLKYSLFDNRAYASAAVFRIEQRNVAELAGMAGGMSYYTQSDGLTSEGFEAEIAGEITDGFRISAGYTFLDINDRNGSRANTYIPEHTFKMLASYQIPNIPLELGAGVRFQSRTYGTNVEQDAFAIVDLMAKYRINENLSASLNLRNVGDEKYWNSLYWAGAFGQAFYGAPRSVDFSLLYEF